MNIRMKRRLTPLEIKCILRQVVPPATLAYGTRVAVKKKLHESLRRQLENIRNISSWSQRPHTIYKEPLSRIHK